MSYESASLYELTLKTTGFSVRRDAYGGNLEEALMELDDLAVLYPLIEVRHIGIGMRRIAAQLVSGQEIHRKRDIQDTPTRQIIDAVRENVPQLEEGRTNLTFSSMRVLSKPKSIDQFITVIAEGSDADDILGERRAVLTTVNSVTGKNESWHDRPLDMTVAYVPHYAGQRVLERTLETLDDLLPLHADFYKADIRPHLH